MAYKILTKNGIDNSNIDGARGEYFNSGMRDGIVQGALSEGLFTATASNIISLDTCELRIAGHRIVIDEPVYHTFTNAPSTDTRYAFVAQIIVDDNQNVDFSLFVQTANTPLIQNDLYKTITGAGTYQVEIGRFTLLTSLTIEDVVRTIDIITGGIGGGSGSEINIGTVTTQTLDSNVDAEVDVSSRYEEDEGKEYLDFTFGIPKAEVNVDAELSKTSSNPVQNKIITSAMNDITNNITVISNSNGGFIAGMGATATQSNSGGVVIGKLAIDNSSSDKSIAIGRTANAGVNGGIAIGSGSQANNSGIAVGSSASATGTNSIQLGQGTNSNPKTFQVYDDNIYDANTHTLKVEKAEVNGKPVATVNTATQLHATSGVQVGWYQVANLKTNGNYDIKIKQAYNYNLPEAIHLSISINNRLSTVKPFASIAQLSGVNPGAFSLSKIRVRQGTDEGTTFLDVYNPDQLWNTTWVDITSDSQDVVVETNNPFQFIGTEDNPSGYKISSLDLVTGFNTNSLSVNNEEWQKIDFLTLDSGVGPLSAVSERGRNYLRNSMVETSGVVITESGWYRVAQLTDYMSGKVDICKQYNYGLSQVVSIDFGLAYRVDASSSYLKVTSTNKFNASQCIDQVRIAQYVDDSTSFPYLEVHINAVSGQGNSYWSVFKDISAAYGAELTSNFQMLAFEPASGTPIVTKVIDVKGDVNVSTLNADNTVTISGTVSNLNTISQPVNSTQTYVFTGGCANAPITDSGMVIQMQESTAYCTQLVIANDADASTWRRSYRDGTWTAWKNIDGSVDLIYDMNNPNYQLGYPNGLVGGKSIEIDYSKYKKLRIYAQATIGPQPYFSSTEFNIDGDVVDNTLTISDFSGTYVYFLHIRATKAQNRVALFYTMKITNNDGTITAEKLYANETVVLTKIEGLY